MEITPEQKEAVALWAKEGLSLAEIQRRLDEEFSLSMTYMDVRFLVDDLELTLQDDETRSADSTIHDGGRESASEATAPDQADTPTADEEPFGNSAADLLSDEVNVEVDRLLKPGALVSGSVKFSDGMRAEWSIDQLGRLDINPGQEGYRPSPEDLRSFQEQLQRALEKKGF